MRFRKELYIALSAAIAITAACLVSCGYTSCISSRYSCAKGYDNPDSSHAAITAEFRLRRGESYSRRSEGKNAAPYLISLGDDCRPPWADCNCWVAIDIGDRGGLREEIGPWHKPVTGLFTNSLNSKNEHQFGTISVRKISLDTYSVINCEGFYYE